jgi:hypothetical protein
VAIAAQVRHFVALGREFEWKLYARDQPGDLAVRRRAAGFRPEPEETLMVARIRDLSLGVKLPKSVRLLAVTGPSGVDLAADVHEQAFGTSAARLRYRMLSQLADAPQTVRIVVAMAGDVPVYAARMELNPGTDFASLWGGGTVAGWRGRGIYRAVVAYRARIAAELGYRYLHVDASSQSRPILQRLGFAALSTTTPHVYQPYRSHHGCVVVVALNRVGTLTEIRGPAASLTAMDDPRSPALEGYCPGPAATSTFA